MTRRPGCLLLAPLAGWIWPVWTGKAGRVLKVPAEHKLVEIAMSTNRLEMYIRIY